MKICTFVLLLSLPFFLCARQIDTFYGPIEVEEPVLLELIDHPIFQRLKYIHQYGVSYYTTHKEEYNRYDHSIGVFAILRAKGASLDEQIAGLLHDVSHTAFSHVGDWVFGKEYHEKDYQNCTHLSFLERSGLEEVLKKHQYTAEQILPEHVMFPALECPLPDLCADRIDYNIQGAYYRGFITLEEAKFIFDDLQFIDKRWESTRPDLMKKLTLFSLYMTENCWGSADNHLMSRSLADAILRGIELESISSDDLHFGTDQEIWDHLVSHDDLFIKEKMGMVLEIGNHFAIVDPKACDFIIKTKFRGIDPLIKSDAKCSPLTLVDPHLGSEFHKVKRIIEAGWPVKLLSK